MGQQNARILIRIPDALVSDLKKIAAAERNAVSAVIRRMLAAAAAQETRDAGR